MESNKRIRFCSNYKVSLVDILLSKVAIVVRNLQAGSDWLVYPAVKREEVLRDFIPTLTTIKDIQDTTSLRAIHRLVSEVPYLMVTRDSRMIVETQVVTKVNMSLLFKVRAAQRASNSKNDVIDLRGSF
jgi:hypothetical protein